MLRLEIADAFKQHRSLNYRICHLTKNVTNSLPLTICNTFFRTQHVRLQKMRIFEHNRLNKKLNWHSEGHTIKK